MSAFLFRRCATVCGTVVSVGSFTAVETSFLCRYLGHRRFADMIQFNADKKHWESVCKRCGVRMIRTREGWQVQQAEPPGGPTA
jgi:hypothetical protein